MWFIEFVRKNYIKDSQKKSKTMLNVCLLLLPLDLFIFFSSWKINFLVSHLSRKGRGSSGRENKNNKFREKCLKVIIYMPLSPLQNALLTCELQGVRGTETMLRVIKNFRKLCQNVLLNKYNMRACIWSVGGCYRIIIFLDNLKLLVHF